MQIVVALYEENNEVYASLGLTREECQIIIADTISKAGIVWQTDYNEDESDKDSGSMDNHDDYNPDSEIDVIYDQASFAYTLTPSAILGRLINWGWIRSDFDEKLNTYVIAFPQYSQMYAELFKKLLVDDDSREKTAEKTQEEMAYLNRHHINWVQFQDWHNKHHWPLGGTRTQLDEVYMDIANREVYTSSVKNYIEAQHRFGMKSMFYNLCFGALKDAAADGVKEEWYLFKDASHTTKDSHDLPGGWKSNIYLVDPSNKEWQKYLNERNDDVYANFAFDGYQIDQLGRRSTLYNYNGIPVNLREGYASFIEATKQAHPDKSLVMNAVSRYGARQIGETGKVDFFYNEVWADEADFTNLKAILYENGVYGNYQLNTVFAAYMNYNKADNRGEFNTPGILLTDAVMFALGGSHLELGGDHMLCKEYFPNENLTMSEELKSASMYIR